MLLHLSVILCLALGSRGCGSGSGRCTLKWPHPSGHSLDTLPPLDTHTHTHTHTLGNTLVTHTHLSLGSRSGWYASYWNAFLSYNYQQFISERKFHIEFHTAITIKIISRNISRKVDKTLPLPSMTSQASVTSTSLRHKKAFQ